MIGNLFFGRNFQIYIGKDGAGFGIEFLKLILGSVKGGRDARRRSFFRKRRGKAGEGGILFLCICDGEETLSSAGLERRFGFRPKGAGTGGGAVKVVFNVIATARAPYGPFLRFNLAVKEGELRAAIGTGERIIHGDFLWKQCKVQSTHLILCNMGAVADG